MSRSDRMVKKVLLYIIATALLLSSFFYIVNELSVLRSYTITISTYNQYWEVFGKELLSPYILNLIIYPLTAIVILKYSNKELDK
jgi:hypothetical protein